MVALEPRLPRHPWYHSQSHRHLRQRQPLKVPVLLRLVVVVADPLCVTRGEGSGR